MGYFTNSKLFHKIIFFMHSSLGCVLKVKVISLKKFTPKCWLKISHRINSYRAKDVTHQYKYEPGVILSLKCTSKCKT